MMPFRILTILVAAALHAKAASAADLVSELSALRQQGCAGATAPPLIPNAALDSAAQRVARGEPLRKSIEDAGYRAVRSALIRLSGAMTNAEFARLVGTRYCAQIADEDLRDVGVYRRDKEIWIVLAEPFSVPTLDTATVRRRVLAVANEARAQARRCGGQQYSPAAPLKWSAALERAAALHARDMAAHSVMRHTGSDGSGPGERVSRIGYAWLAVAENVAAGQRDADAVITSWLASPGHCANLMDAGFTETGFAFATNPNSGPGVYWAQVFAAPDAATTEPAARRENAARRARNKR